METVACPSAYLMRAHLWGLGVPPRLQRLLPRHVLHLHSVECAQVLLHERHDTLKMFAASNARTGDLAVSQLSCAQRR